MFCKLVGVDDDKIAVGDFFDECPPAWLTKCRTGFCGGVERFGQPLKCLPFIGRKQKRPAFVRCFAHGILSGQFNDMPRSMALLRFGQFGEAVAHLGFSLLLCHAVERSIVFRVDMLFPEAAVAGVILNGFFVIHGFSLLFFF